MIHSTTRARLVTAGIGVAAIASLTLVGCSSTPTTNTPAPSDSAAAPSVSLPAEWANEDLVAPAVVGYPPYAYLDGSDIKGISTDLAVALGGPWGKTVTLKQDSFENAVLGVDNGTYFGVFGADITADREATYDQVPIDVAGLLADAGVEFGYLYGDDLYSGALAYDLGLDDAVAVQARRVAAVFAKHGVREVITIDPHTTHMLRSVYPELLDKFDVRVRTYLEVLAERAPAVCNPLSGELTIHDSCLFARREGVLTQPRDLLTRAGIAIREPAASGRSTWCCGGPVESLYPEKAVANARRRVAQ